MRSEQLWERWWKRRRCRGTFEVVRRSSGGVSIVVLPYPRERVLRRGMLDPWQGDETKVRGWPVDAPPHLARKARR